MDQNNDAIRVSDLTFTYKNSDEPVLKDVDLVVKRGRFTVIMGRTGAGKTTLSMLFNGIIPQVLEGEVKGSIISGGLDVSKYRVQTVAKELGLVVQDPETQIFGRTVREDVAFGPRNYLVPREEILERIADSLHKVRLDGYEDRETSQLSGGEKQRLAIAGILAMKPSIVVLDEPTSELDPTGREEIYTTMYDLLKENGITVVAIEHSSQEISEKADEIVILDDNHIVWKGDPRDFFKNLDLVEKYGIKPLPVSVVGWELYKKGLIGKEEIPLTIDEGFELISKLLDGRKLISKKEPSGEKQREVLIKLENVDFEYGNGKEALHDIDLEIRDGDYLALIGQNGAGKTTMAKLFNALHKPKKGTVTVCGKNTVKEEPNTLAQYVGYVFQNPDNQIFSTSVYKEMEYGLKNAGISPEESDKRIREVAEMLGLTDVLEEHPFSLGKGQRQRLAVASILVLKPKILVVDEPTTGQDWDGIQNMMKLMDTLHEQGTTVVMITHDMDVVAKHANRAVVMTHGKIVADGSVREVMSEKDKLADAYVTRPQIVELSSRLYGPTGDLCLTAGELADRIIETLGEGTR